MHLKLGTSPSIDPSLLRRNAARRTRRKAALQRAVVEALEQRELFSTVPAGYRQIQTLTVTPGNQASSITLQSGKNYLVTVSGVATFNYQTGYTGDADGYVVTGDSQHAVGSNTDWAGADYTFDGSDPTTYRFYNWSFNIADSNITPPGNHVYYRSFAGQNQPFRASFCTFGSAYCSGSFSLTVFEAGETPTSPTGADENKSLPQPTNANGGDPVSYFDGTLIFDRPDLTSGSGWGQTRSWTNRQDQVGNNVNGNNWVVNEQSFLTTIAMSSTSSTMLAVRIVKSGSQAALFSGSTSSFVADGYAQDTLTVANTGTSSEVYTWTTTLGRVYKYYGTNTNIAAALRGQLQSFTDESGNLTTLSYTSGQLTQMSRSVTVNGTTASEVFAYTYYSATDDYGAYIGKVQSVELKRSTNWGAYETVGSVLYKYYNGTAAGTTTFGNAGDLWTVSYRTSDGTAYDTELYRYYTSYDAPGYLGGLKFVVDKDGYRRLTVAEKALGKTPETASDAELAPYAYLYLEYDLTQRVTKQLVAGFGGTNGAGTLGLGTYSFSYTSSSYTLGYNTWAMKTLETLPDGSTNTVYSNGYGELMLKDHTDSSGTHWRDYYRYDSTGRLIVHANPQAVTGYDDQNYQDLVNFSNATSNYIADASGLLEITDYYTSTTATVSSGDTLSLSNATAGGVLGYRMDQKVRLGDLSSDVLVASYQYFGHTDANGATYYVRATESAYPDNSTNSRTTSYAYTFYSGTNQAHLLTVTPPVVTSGQFGSNVAESYDTVYDTLGRPTWVRDEDGFLTYTEYDPKTGLVAKTIKDVDTTKTSSFYGLISGWTTPSGGGLHLQTTTSYAVTAGGGITTFTDPNNNNATAPTYTSYTLYDTAHKATFNIGAATLTVNSSGNGILTTLTPITMVRTGLGYTDPSYSSYAGTYTETLTFTGTLTVTAGQIDFPQFQTANNTALLSLIGTGNATASQFTIRSLTRELYNSAGQLWKFTSYAAIDNTTYLNTATSSAYSGSTTSFYSTVYGYTAGGYNDRTVSATGTITRRSYDSLGRVVNTWVGTNDSAGSWTPGSTISNNLTLISVNEYDGNGPGDGNLTKVTVKPNDGSLDRVSEYLYDWRDRLVATKGSSTDSGSDTNTHPITYFDLDNLGEITATSAFDGDSSGSGGYTFSYTNGVPTKPTSLLLTSYKTTEYDNQGRAFRTSTYSVNPTSGSYSGPAIVSQSWFDKRGNPIASYTSGGTVSKSTYDGAGRVTATYVTDGGATANSGNILTSWADAGTTGGDIVLSQIEYDYDANGNVLRTTSRDRFHDATGNGPLGTPSSSQPKARVSYTVYYYDGADRKIAAVDVGTNGGSAYSRPSTVPTASTSTLLLTLYHYDLSGHLDNVTDPKGIVAHTEYDALGRTTKTVANYVDGVPSSADDQTTLYTYDGADHVLTITADMPAGTPDQVTQYVYGVDKTTLLNSGDTNSKSAISSNDLLYQVNYPDKNTGAASSNPADQNTFVYNALGETLYKRDQLGVIHKYVYDALGRQTSDQVVSTAGPINLANPSFESPSTSTYVTAPSSAGWTFTGNSGIAKTMATWTPPATVNGNQYGWVTNGSAISQTFSNAASGTYRLTLQASQVNSTQIMSLVIAIDGTTVKTIRPSYGGASWDTYFADFTIAGGQHTLSITGSGSGAAAIDVAWVASYESMASIPTVSNNGFENGTTGWTAAGSYGTTTLSAAPEGSTVGYVDGTTGSLAQTLKNVSPGNYILAFSGRSSSSGTATALSIVLDGNGTSTSLGTLTLSATAPTSFVKFTVPTLGDYTIKFVSASTTRAYIDDVNILPGSVPVLNNGFQTPAMTASPNYQYSPANASWTFYSGGISATNGGFFAQGAAAPPDGSNQYAFLQSAGNSPSSQAYMTQNLQFFAGGTYQIQFYAAERYSGGAVNVQDFDIYVDGNLVSPSSHLKPSGSGWRSMASNLFTVSAGSHLIKFVTVNSANSADATVLIDSVSVNLADSLVANGFMSDPTLGSPYYEYQPSSTGWTYANSAGISQTNGGFFTQGATTSPDGSNQYAFLQSAYTSGAQASMSQNVEFTFTGSYQIRFYAAQRYSGGAANTQDFDVYIDNVLVSPAAHLKPAAAAWQTMITDPVTVTAGTHILKFVTVNSANSADNTVLIDGVTLICQMPTAFAGVDTSVQRIDTSYNPQGLVNKVTSYSTTAGTTAVNQVQNTYNGLGQLLTQAQEHTGTVTGSSLAVQYGYDSLAKGSRLTSIVYPNGGTLTYSYGSGLNDVISRLDSLQQGTLTLEAYAYLGLSTVVKRSHPENGVDLTLVKLSGESDGPAGDQYTGIDQFGRIVDQRWVNGSGTSVDRYLYAYDADSNRSSKTNTNATSNNETYTYDGLNRLTGVDGANGTANDQTWSLDALGNMSTVTTAGVTDYRQTNSRNQLLSMNATSTTVTAGSYLAYDQNGNVILDDHGYVLKYDAWNRLVTVRNLTGTLKSFAYDGLGRRIEDTVSGSTTHSYFSAAWQVLEERSGTPTSVGSSAKTQYVWGPTYVDQLVLRTRDTDANGTLDEKLYVLQDANFDVTGIVDASGTVQERFVFDAYGKKAVLNASWAIVTDSKSWVVGHQGLFEDATIGWIHNRNRIYSVSMQRFGQSDPMGYVDGISVYAAYGNSPIFRTDPSGFAFINVSPTLGDFGTLFRRGNFPGYPQPTNEYFEGNFVKGVDWSPTNPLVNQDYVNDLGLPNGNSTAIPDWTAGGQFANPDAVSYGPAPGIGSNPGGAPEVSVNPGNVLMDWFHMPEGGPAFPFSPGDALEAVTNPLPNPIGPFDSWGVVPGAPQTGPWTAPINSWEAVPGAPQTGPWTTPINSWEVGIGAAETEASVGSFGYAGFGTIGSGALYGTGAVALGVGLGWAIHASGLGHYIGTDAAGNAIANSVVTPKGEEVNEANAALSRKMWSEYYQSKDQPRKC